MAGRIVVTGRVPEPALELLREAGDHGGGSPGNGQAHSPNGKPRAPGRRR